MADDTEDEGVFFGMHEFEEMLANFEYEERCVHNSTRAVGVKLSAPCHRQGFNAFYSEGLLFLLCVICDTIIARVPVAALEIVNDQERLN